MKGAASLQLPASGPCRLSLLATGYPSPCRLRDSFAAMHGRRPASPKELSDAGPQQHLGVAFPAAVLLCSFLSIPDSLQHRPRFAFLTGMIDKASESTWDELEDSIQVVGV